MKDIRRLLGMLFLVGVGFSTCTYGEILHEERTEQVITKGAIYIHEQLLMSEGWRNINILKINLDEGNVSLKPIESSSGVERQTILQMATNAGAIAAINADYFDMSTSNTPSLGMYVEDGKLKHGYNSNYSSLGPNKNMATFLVDTSNTPSMEYYGVSIRINANGSFVGAAATKNNIPSSITRPIILDNTYYKTTNNIVSQHKTLYSIVVEDNTVVYLSKSGEVVNIPANGYVILVPESSANEYYTKLKLGTNVDLEETLYLTSGLTTAINNMKLGIGGSGIIMKNGESYNQGAHKVTPNAQVARTVVATVKGSNEVLLITIDGVGDYKGASHNQLIELLKRYRVDTAMYLDGGGSTTFVSRNFAEGELKLQNSPAGGSQRKVVNGLGVFTTSPKGTLTSLYVEPTRQRTFIGESISLKVKAVDENSNPLSVDKMQVTYSVVGGAGGFSGNTFTPTSTGKLMLIANCNGIEAATEITVSDKPVGLFIEPSLVQMKVGASKTVQVYGVDAAGYKIPLNANSISWSSDSSRIGATNNTILATGEGLGKLTASYKGVSNQIGVVVGDGVVPVESFEASKGNWNGDTSSVKGKVELSYAEKYHGKQSLKMSYTFMPSSERQIAYTVFDKPISIPEDAASINMWLNAQRQGHVAKVEVVDAKGAKFYLKLSESLNFTGWKYVSAALPQNMVLPAKVTKFYTYANSNSTKISTAVYIDHVSITRGFRDRAGTTTRADYTFDPFYKATLQQAIGGQSIIHVVGQTKVNSMLMGAETLGSISQQLSSGAGLVLQASNNNSPLSLSPTTYTYKNTYESFDYNRTKILMLGTDSGGLRQTQEKAWIYLKQALSTTDAKNIILVMSKNPLTQFSDSLEGKALHNYLKEFKDKNIFVITAGGTENEVRLEDGIRYIRTCGINVVTDNYKDGSFVKFKLDGDKIYYTFEAFR